MAKKRAQRSGTKKATNKQSARPKPAAKAPVAKAPVAKPAARPPQPAPRSAAPARQAAPTPLLEQARSLREAIERSKLTAPDPWGYTTKARGWIQRADQVLSRIESSADAAGTRKTLETLRGEIEGDRDFQAARRLF